MYTNLKPFPKLMYLLDWQLQNFCDNDKPRKLEREGEFHCGIIIGPDQTIIYIQEKVILLVPCDEYIENAAVLCQSDVFEFKQKYILRFPKLPNYKLFKMKRKTASQHGLFECKDRSFIVEHHICDGHYDCTDRWDEEICNRKVVYHNVYKYKINTHSDFYFKCNDKSTVPISKICDCREDCSDASDEKHHLCSYKTCTTVNDIFSISNRGNSSKTPKYFCIDYLLLSRWGYSYPEVMISPDPPIKHIHLFRDGNLDCLSGMDEAYPEQVIIFPAFKCSQENIYVDYKNLQDGIKHCVKSYDDELISLFNHNCHEFQCKCFGFAVWCKDVVSIPYLNRWTKVLIISSNELQPFQNITSVSVFRNLTYLLSLKIQLSLKYIIDDLFLSLQYLTILDLSLNSISSISERMFLGLQNIHFLNLSHNALISIAETSFHPLLQLSILDISHSMSQIHYFTANIFSLHVKSIHVAITETCCMISTTNCFVKMIKIEVKCFRILHSLEYRIVSLMLACIVISLNMWCLFMWSLKSKFRQKLKNISSKK